MAGKISPDGKAVAFDVLDVSGSTQRGRMADTVFTIVDANHHLEEWKFNYPGGKRMTGRFDLPPEPLDKYHRCASFFLNRR